MIWKPKRPADYIVRGSGSDDRPYLRRWWIIPKNRFFNIYLHQILESDDDRALHDHPSFNVSIVLKGGYWEVMPLYKRMWPHSRDVTMKWRRAGSIIFRRSTTPHRLVLSKRNGYLHGRRCQESWTLFITGPRVRQWGFWCPSGWRDYKTFSDPKNPGEIGRGCD